MQELPKDREIRGGAAGVDLDATVRKVSNGTRKSKPASRLPGPPAEADSLDPSGEEVAATFEGGGHAGQSHDEACMRARTEETPQV